MAKETLIRIRGVWNDIYGWGTGYYSQEKYLAWKNFWQNPTLKDGKKPIFWKAFIEDKGYCDNEYLVTTSGSIYLHPMDFTTILKSCGVSDGNGNHFKSEIDELKNLCEVVAEKCDGTFTMEYSEEISVEF